MFGAGAWNWRLTRSCGQGIAFADRRPDRLAANRALQAKGSHQPLHCAAGNLATFPL
jgi:hypothetical protein